MLKVQRGVYGKRRKSFIQSIKAIPAYIWNIYLLNCEHGFMAKLFSIMAIDWLRNFAYLKPLQYSKKPRQVGCYLRSWDGTKLVFASQVQSLQ